MASVASWLSASPSNAPICSRICGPNDRRPVPQAIMVLKGIILGEGFNRGWLPRTCAPAKYGSADALAAGNQDLQENALKRDRNFRVLAAHRSFQGLGYFDLGEFSRRAFGDQVA